MRLITAGPAADDGSLRGILEIDLKPGWKTYWRDPGEAGVPPSLDVSKSENVGGAEIAFPAPERHDDGYGPWAGYGASVSLPVTFRIADTAKPWRLQADAFLGICQTICVPVQASFALSSDQRDDAEDKAAVEAAFKALPMAASAAFGIVKGEREGNRIVFTATLTDGAEKPELFLDGLGQFTFEDFTSAKSPDGWRFAVRVAAEPKDKKTLALPYTLKAGDRAVSGTVTLP
ncbi:hypothetical protein NGM99_01965 [Mesorhizobium sp. RP14(2022)]|uniref:Thiol:disulfide interchange protein DsbD N-terminal domain-containing protein n=1 Tax=Mesorhizobium liriopis TaxID=2953882 RepID=A0ABT1C327_9HYPH|nr:hypothetical protein [Mesorhizobium liriopis]